MPPLCPNFSLAGSALMLPLCQLCAETSQDRGEGSRFGMIIPHRLPFLGEVSEMDRKIIAISEKAAMNEITLKL
jgi:hypothetical protein